MPGRSRRRREPRSPEPSRGERPSEPSPARQPAWSPGPPSQAREPRPQAWEQEWASPSLKEPEQQPERPPVAPVEQAQRVAAWQPQARARQPASAVARTRPSRHQQPSKEPAAISRGGLSSFGPPSSRWERPGTITQVASRVLRKSPAPTWEITSPRRVPAGARRGGSRDRDRSSAPRGRRRLRCSESGNHDLRGDRPPLRWRGIRHDRRRTA